MTPDITITTDAPVQIDVGAAQIIAGSDVFGKTRFPSIENLHHLVIFGGGEEWQALFKDGVLVEQAHEIVPADLAKHVPIASLKYEDMPLEVVKYLYEAGDFPHGITLDAARRYTGQE